MDSAATSFSSSTPSPVDYIVLLILRPIAAISFVFVFISLGWLLAWKLVLVHVPLVQEIFGLRKKPAKFKPQTRRISRYYNSINARNSSATGCSIIGCGLISFMGMILGLQSTEEAAR